MSDIEEMVPRVPDGHRDCDSQNDTAVPPIPPMLMVVAKNTAHIKKLLHVMVYGFIALTVAVAVIDIIRMTLLSK